MDANVFVKHPSWYATVCVYPLLGKVMMIYSFSFIYSSKYENQIRNFTVMNMTTLFCKLRGHELKSGRLKEEEESEK